MTLTQINIYPIKSLAGIGLTIANAYEKGLEYDRRWMLIDEDNKFMTQRLLPELVLFKTQIIENNIVVFHKYSPENILKIPLNILNGNSFEVKIWGDIVTVIHYNLEADNWFKKILNIKCKLVFLPEKNTRFVDVNFAQNNEMVSLADGYPFLIIGENSLNNLNQKLNDKILMNRFRPNFVFSGGEPFCEDDWVNFSIGTAIFASVKPCARCVVTTINQENGIKEKEPLKTLATYRMINNKVNFGQNVLLKKLGTVAVGDEIILKQNSKIKTMK